MYRPWSFRAARRAADSRSLRPLLVGFEESRVAASRVGANRAKAPAIEPKDLRIAWTVPADRPPARSLQTCLQG